MGLDDVVLSADVVIGYQGEGWLLLLVFWPALFGLPVLSVNRQLVVVY